MIAVFVIKFDVEVSRVDLKHVPLKRSVSESDGRFWLLFIPFGKAPTINKARSSLWSTSWPMDHGPEALARPSCVQAGFFRRAASGKDNPKIPPNASEPSDGSTVSSR